VEHLSQIPCSISADAAQHSYWLLMLELTSFANNRMRCQGCWRRCRCVYQKAKEVTWEGMLFFIDSTIIIFIY